jgi:hypothetical protein
LEEPAVTVLSVLTPYSLQNDEYEGVKQNLVKRMGVKCGYPLFRKEEHTLKVAECKLLRKLIGPNKDGNK